MGLLRVLLAIAVVLAHCGSLWGYTGVGGLAAVQCFFVISGFYMSMILTEKYQGAGSYRLFLSNRFMRIYPVYWLVLAMTFGAAGVTYLLGRSPLFLGDFGHFGQLAAAGKAVVVVMTLFIFLQDWSFLVNFGADGALGFRPSMRPTSDALWMFLVIPQAWTLGVELTFYVVAPFLCRARTSLIVILMVFSLGVRVATYQFWIHDDPFEYRFFPSELLLFLAGILAYRWGRSVRFARLPRPGLWLLAAVLMAHVFAFQYLPAGESKRWTLYALATISLPALFTITKKWRVDRWIGELSYPVYLCHWFVIVILRTVGIGDSPMLYVAVSILLSIGLLLGVKPIEALRQRRATRLGT